MTLNANELHELEISISERIYIQIEKWHLYLGDAGLAEALALECQANLDEGVALAARKGLESVSVQLGGGSFRLPLARLIPTSLIFDLEEILSSYTS